MASNETSDLDNGIKTGSRVKRDGQLHNNKMQSLMLQEKAKSVPVRS